MLYSLMKTPIVRLLLLVSLLSCNTENNQTVETVENSEPKPETEKEVIIPRYRDNVSKAPAASYSVKTDDMLNDWYFTLNLYETPETFKYLMKFQFEEIRGEDTLRLPEASTALKPQLKKGPEKYSVIIGFEDPEDGSFKEYKKLFVEGNSLKLRTIRQYSAILKSN